MYPESRKNESVKEDMSSFCLNLVVYMLRSIIVRMEKSKIKDKIKDKIKEGEKEKE